MAKEEIEPEDIEVEIDIDGEEIDILDDLAQGTPWNQMRIFGLLIAAPETMN